MKNLFIFIIFISSSILFNHCTEASDKEVSSQETKPTESYQEGSICLIEDGTNGYGVAKVLVIADGAVHVKLYANTYETKPESIDLGTLNMGTIENGEFGIGHVPLEKTGFDNWNPEEIGIEEVSEEELEGYYYWLDQY